MNKTKVYLLLILWLALASRLFDLGKIPAILNRDEAALAYNAYLIGESGQDEWQMHYPLLFKSFGDYKLPGYIYLLSVIFKVLPMTDFMVRLPSALAGSLLVLVAFYFAQNILKVRRNVALVMALLIAINPVFFFYSRIAFEANLALLFFVSSLYLFLLKKPRYFLASLLMIMAILIYNTPLLLLPFMILAIVYRYGLKNFKSWLLTSVLLGTIFVFFLILFRDLTTQKSAITIFNDPTTWNDFTLYRASLSDFWQGIIGNKYCFYGQLLWQHFLKSFSLDFLVQNGGSHPWHALPNYGHLFYVTYFLAIFTLIDLIGEMLTALLDRTAKFNREHLFLLLVLFSSLAPSVITVDSPHATRSLFFFFMLIVFATLFVDKLCRVFKNYKKLIISMLCLLLTVEAAKYYRRYFVDYINEQPSSLFVEYQTLIKEAQDKYSKESVAVIDGGGYQYIVTAWYLRVPSTQFFATMKYQNADRINFYYGEKLLNYHFIKDIADRSSAERILLSQDSGLVKYE